jgi:RNA polymerase sigma factor (sigma-70 family)
MEENSDSELVLLARQGNKEAFGLLIKRYQTMARRVAGRMIADEDTAQELVQESLLQAYLSLDRLQSPQHFRSWLCGIVLNLCRNHLRENKIVYFSLEAMAGGLKWDAIPFADESGNPERIAEERELQKTMMDAINSLAVADRQITLQFYFEQLSVREIAMIQGISPGVVKVRLHRARKRLRGRLITQYPEIIPGKMRRENMVKENMVRVKIADVVKRERKDTQGNPYILYVVLLQDEAGKRLLPIWIGPFEGQSIAAAMRGFNTPRPRTFYFTANLLKAVNARIEQVLISKLENDTFYATVKIRCGESLSEIDARPSDALNLAVLTGSPIFAADNIMTNAGFEVPETENKELAFSGADSILRDITEEQKRFTINQMTKIDHDKARQELIKVITGEK